MGGRRCRSVSFLRPPSLARETAKEFLSSVAAPTTASGRNYSLNTGTNWVGWSTIGGGPFFRPLPRPPLPPMAMSSHLVGRGMDDGYYHVIAPTSEAAGGGGSGMSHRSGCFRSGPAVPCASSDESKDARLRCADHAAASTAEHSPECQHAPSTGAPLPEYGPDCARPRRHPTLGSNSTSRG